MTGRSQPQQLKYCDVTIHATMVQLRQADDGKHDIAVGQKEGAVINVEEAAVGRGLMSRGRRRVTNERQWDRIDAAVKTQLVRVRIDRKQHFDLIEGIASRRPGYPCSGDRRSVPCRSTSTSFV